LRYWAEALLHEQRLREVFNPVAIRILWVQHRIGKQNWQYRFWRIFIDHPPLEKQGVLLYEEIHSLVDKNCCKDFFCRLPFGYWLWQKIGLFRHGDMDSADYVLKVFKQHVSRSGYDDALMGKKILELGPDDSIATAILAKCYAANAILLDAGAYAKSDVWGYKKLVAEPCVSTSVHTPGL
jgi:hypothetical protein